MNCYQINKNFIGYIEQTIPTELQEQIGVHLNGCHNCSELYKNIVATYTIYEKLPLPEVNPYFYTRLEQKLKSKHQLNQKFVPQIIWKLQPVAATILVFIGIGSGILIGTSISGSEITFKKPNRSEVLEVYASDYNLVSTGDESLAILMNNE